MREYGDKTDYWRYGVMVVVICLLGVASVWAQTAIPAPSSPVIDSVGFLSARDKTALEAELLTFHRATGSQIAVLIVANVAPEEPFDYGTRVMDQWKLGRAGVDDGVLLLLVTQARHSQLFVGRGLEGALPDALAKRILQDSLAPRLARGQRGEGVTAAVRAIESAIRQEALPLPPKPMPTPQSVGESVERYYFALAVLIVGGILRRLWGRGVGSLITGTLTSCVALLLGASVFVALGLGLVGFVITLIWRAGLAGFPGGGPPDGGSSGGTSGWGGGGGDYGGGGASGKW